MPRRARHFKPDAIFHTGNRGVDRQPIFLGDPDRRFFTDCMAELTIETGIRSVAHCLMPNHFHWVLATDSQGFDEVFRRLLTRHAVRYNRLHQRTGHLFEDRHWSFHCAHLDRIEDVVAYVHLNPVRAGLARHPSEWSWSSYIAWAGGETGFTDIRRLAEVSNRSIESLIHGHAERIERELSPRSGKLTPESLIEDVAGLFGMEARELQPPARGEQVTRVKLALVERARRAGIPISALADSLRCTPGPLYALQKRTTPRK